LPPTEAPPCCYPILCALWVLSWLFDSDLIPFPPFWAVPARHLALFRHGRAREPKNQPSRHRTKSAAESVAASLPSAKLAPAAKPKLANEPPHPSRDARKNSTNGRIYLDLPGFAWICLDLARSAPAGPHLVTLAAPSIQHSRVRAAAPILHFALCTLHFAFSKNPGGPDIERPPSPSSALLRYAGGIKYGAAKSAI
jgi:hypothetical protein